MLSDSFKDMLLTEAKGNLKNGGRGIGNVLESVLLNGLSDVLVEVMGNDVSSVRITGKADDGKLLYEMQ